MAILAKTVYVRDTERNRDIILRAGDEPAPEYAALVRNPGAWEGGQLPDQDADSGQGDSGKDDTDQVAPAAKKTAARKTAAASKPARGRDAAEKGDSGE